MGIRAPRELNTVRHDPTNEVLKNYVSLEDSVKAAYELSALDTTLNSVARMDALDALSKEDQELIPPEELNKRYPGLPSPFVEPKSARVAEEIVRRIQERQDLAGIISRGPKGIGADVVRFSAAMVPHALDPVNLAADLTVGGALLTVGRGAKIAHSAASMERVLARGAAEGVLGNLAVEPLAMAAAKQEMQDYTVAQAFTNVVAGGVFFPAAKYGVSKVAGFVRRLGPTHVEATAQGAVTQLASGKRVDVDPLVRDFVNETKHLPTWANEYKFRALDLGNLKGTKMYVATNKPSAQIKDSVVLDEDFGPGVYLTDAPNVANGVSARKLSNKHGPVLEVSLEGAKLLDLENSLDPRVKQALTPIVEEVLGKQRMKRVETGRQIFEELSDAIENGKAKDADIERINKAIEEAGFDGFRYEGGQLTKDAPVHNGIKLFSPNKLKEVQRLRSELPPPPSNKEVGDTLARNQDFKSETNFDDAAFKEFQESGKGFETEVKPEKISQEADAAVEELKSLKDQELLTEGEIKELDAINEMKRVEEETDEMIKSATYCVGLGRG